MASPAEQNRDIWESIAGWWDDRAGRDGNDFHRHTVGPLTEELLGVSAGERVLDVACGNGQFSRRLAALGAEVVAFDQAPTFVERARAYGGGPIEYLVLDATDRDTLVALGEGAFDAAVANMALMDMPEVEPLFSALAVLLRPGGRFVFTVLHPCFGYGPAPAPGPEAADSRRARGVARVYGLVARASAIVPARVRLPLVRRADALAAGLASYRYLDARAVAATGIVGQPASHWYFHRPLHELLGPAFAAGLVLDAVAEPRFWDTPYGAPALLACRLRRPAA